MRVLYIAKHNSGDNDDEGAIAYALERLGHQVTCLSEELGHNAPRLSVQYDICLFHKWENIESIRETSRRMPVICWYFDLIETNDSQLSERCSKRVYWMQQITPLCHTIFCTDGDWVDKDKSGRCLWLMQGADERYIGKGLKLDPSHKVAPIIFPGIMYGSKRVEHLEHLKERWGDQFQIFGERNRRDRRHGRQLANIIATSQIVVSPDGPTTDNYWSNRVYLITGFNGFLIHPNCSRLAQHYDTTEVPTYSNREELDEMIATYLPQEEYRQEVAHKAYTRTTKEHLYRHRVDYLIKTVQERLKW